MELKKKSESNLETYKIIIFFFGVITALSVSIWAYESKSYDEIVLDGFGDLEMDALEEEDIEITRPDEVKPPPPPEAPPEAPEEIEIKENEEELVNEAKIEDAETDQDDMIEIEEEEFAEDFIVVEQMPMLGDCKDEDCTQNAIMTFISKNFKYPEIAKANGVEGRVVLEFFVEKDGKIGRVKILKGLDKHVDKAAIEVLYKFNTSKKAPKFTPGKQTGKAVNVKYTVPIKCSIN